MKILIVLIFLPFCFGVTCPINPLPIIFGRHGTTHANQIHYSDSANVILIVGWGDDGLFCQDLQYSGGRPHIGCYQGPPTYSYVWGKQFTSFFSQHEFYGVATNAAGTRGIAILKTSGVVTFQVSDGTVTNARAFPGTLDRFNTRNMQMSNAGFAFLSLQTATTNLWEIVRFNALTVSTSVTWALQTLSAMTPYTLVFDETESILYALTGAGSNFYIFRLHEIDGTLDWYYYKA